MTVYTPGDLTRVSHALEDFMPDTYDLYRAPGSTGQYPTTPKYLRKKCSVQIIPRLVPGGALSGGSETAQTRFMLRVPVEHDVRARDRVIVTNGQTGEITKHTVQSVRGPHSLYTWKLADLSNPE